MARPISEEHPGRLGVGDHVDFTKAISEHDVQQFAAASGDTNPLHLDDEFAEQTRFRGRSPTGRSSEASSAQRWHACQG